MQLTATQYEQIAARRHAALLACNGACDCERCGVVVVDDDGLAIEEGRAVLCDDCAADECERALS